MRRSLTRHERIHSRTEIGVVFREGNGARTPGMRLVCMKNGRAFSRVVVIPAKGFPTAVARNVCRRQTKEAYRALKPGIASGFDIVIVAYQGDFRYSDRLTQLAGLLTRTHLLESASAKE